MPLVCKLYSVTPLFVIISRPTLSDVSVAQYLTLQRFTLQSAMMGELASLSPTRAVFIRPTWAHSFPRQNLTKSAENLVNSAAHRCKADEIPRLNAAKQGKFRRDK